MGIYGFYGFYGIYKIWLFSMNSMAINLVLLISDVPARLGLKATALAWPKAALAFEILRPSPGPKPGQSHGLARWLLAEKNQKKCTTYHYECKPLPAIASSTTHATSRERYTRQLTRRCVSRGEKWVVEALFR